MPSSGLLGAVGSSANTSSNNLQGAAGTAGAGAWAVRRDEGIISGLSEAGDIYLILFKVSCTCENKPCFHTMLTDGSLTVVPSTTYRCC